MDKIVFLDRDGTLNPDKFGYIKHPDEFTLFDFSAKAIKKLNDASFKVVLVSNQSGIARGYFTFDDLDKIHQKMNELLLLEIAIIDKIYTCPYHEKGCVEPYNIHSDLRKPGIGMFLQAKKDFDFKSSESYMIGDKSADIQFGKKSGLKTILVLTGNGQDTLKKRKSWIVQPDYIAQTLQSAVDLILLLEKQKG